MTAFIEGGKRNWSASRDREGHREFKLETQVETTSVFDGPQIVMNTPGLPLVGDPWTFGNDLDFWVFCYPTMKVTPRVKNEPNKHWLVEQTFGTRPLNRCQDASIEDPLLEPQKMSGSFVTEQKTATKDRNGNLIQTSGGQIVKGPLNEWDNGLPTVRIEQNVAALGLELFTSQINRVNDAVLWGKAVRTIKLSGISWERKYWGLCNEYFTRIFDFEINDETFDRDDIMDEGTMCISGAWNNAVPPVYVADGNNLFVRAVDPQGRPIHALLDGLGKIIGKLDLPVPIPLGTVEKYKEANFLLLGIPIILG